MPHPATYHLAGRLAIVTGGLGGFGLAIADRLAANGAIPILWDLPQAVAAYAGPYEIQAVDITDEASVAAAAAALKARHGRLDILVNNAGVVGTVAQTGRSRSPVRRLIDINLIGAFTVCHALLPLLRDTAATTRHGRIVVLASIQAKEGMALAAGYSAAKAGLIALTKTLGKELARDHVLCNAITPSASLTKMSVDAPKARLDDILARIPLGRFLEPEEVAAMTAWLASDRCSFSTGAVFDLSGGRATY